MIVVAEQPPLYNKIITRFPWARHPGVIFTMGPIIYNPSRVKIPRELMKHEETHSERQGNAWVEWWDRYLLDSQFRLEEELAAHRAEYLAYCKRNGSGRGKFLSHVASRLASPLYDNMITLDEAAHAIATSASVSR